MIGACTPSTSNYELKIQIKSIVWTSMSIQPSIDYLWSLLHFQFLPFQLSRIVLLANGDSSNVSIYSVQLEYWIFDIWYILYLPFDIWYILYLPTFARQRPHYVSTSPKILLVSGILTEISSFLKSRGFRGSQFVKK